MIIIWLLSLILFSSFQSKKATYPNKNSKTFRFYNSNRHSTIASAGKQKKCKMNWKVAQIWILLSIQYTFFVCCFVPFLANEPLTTLLARWLLYCSQLIYHHQSTFTMAVESDNRNKPYIFTERLGHIISDLDKTALYFRKALELDVKH